MAVNVVLVVIIITATELHRCTASREGRCRILGLHLKRRGIRKIRCALSRAFFSYVFVVLEIKLVGPD